MIAEIASFGAGFIHPMAGLDHEVAMLAVGVWSGQVGGRMTWAAPLGFVSMMAAGGALGIVGLPLADVEGGILASVVAFGCLIASAYNPRPAFGAALVGAFALFHGYAHGVEMQTGSAASWYAVGFLLATAILHLAGIGLYKALARLRLGGAVRWIGAAVSLAGIVPAVI